MSTTGSLPLYDLPSNTTINLSSQGQTTRLTSIDTAVENMITNGIIFVTAAGNQGVKIAQPTDASNKTNDYWNYWNGTYNGSPLDIQYRYYNRGPSPCTTNSIVTGAMTVGLNASSKNYKASFSNAGYNVTVFAPGWDVRSAVSNTTAYPNSLYFLNGSFKQTNFTGTSAACPQIAGMAALYCQAHPTATQADVKTWLTSNANTSIMYTTGLSDDYTDYESQWGGTAGVAFQPIQGITQIKDSGNTWATVANVYIKTDSSTWTQVEHAYTKTDSSTWKQVY